MPDTAGNATPLLKSATATLETAELKVAVILMGVLGVGDVDDDVSVGTGGESGGGQDTTTEQSHGGEFGSLGDAASAPDVTYTSVRSRCWSQRRWALRLTHYPTAWTL